MRETGMSKSLISVLATLGIFFIYGCATEKKIERHPQGTDEVLEIYRKIELYKRDQPEGESYFGGTMARELEGFSEAATKMTKAQIFLKQQLELPPLGPGRRIFHAKSHGCAYGELKLINDRPLDPDRKTFRGLFNPTAQQSSYRVLARFSN